MQTFALQEELDFHDPAPHAQPLHVDKDFRILRFMLKPGQSIEEHSAPSSPFIAIVLQGNGYFTGADGKEKKIGPNSLVFFASDEEHSVRAGDEELIFIGLLQGVPGTRPDHVGGELHRS